MLEISERGHERRQEGGIGRAIGNIMESWKCLQEDMETLFDEMENMGERGGFLRRRPFIYGLSGRRRLLSRSRRYGRKNGRKTGCERHRTLLPVSLNEERADKTALSQKNRIQ